MKQKSKDLLQILGLVLILATVTLLVVPWILSHPESQQPPFNRLLEAINKQEVKEVEIILSSEDNLSDLSGHYQQLLRETITDPRMNFLEGQGYLHTPASQRDEDTNQYIKEIDLPEYLPQKRAEILESFLSKAQEDEEVRRWINWQKLEERVRLMESPPESADFLDDDDGFDMEPIRAVLSRYRP